MKKNGFTLIELLIVMTILGALAAVVIPSLASFLKSADVAAANTEVANVESSALAYMCDNGDFPTDSVALVTGNYLTGTPKAVYTLDSNGRVSGVTSQTWEGITWSSDKHQWVKK